MEPTYETPQETTESNSPPINTSIQIIAERVQASETGFTMFEVEEEELWVEAYVTSSDAAGNFYKEIYLQDHPQAPQTAMRMLVDQQKLYTTYPLGQQLFIKLNGLGAGNFRGVLSLGMYQADGVTPIAPHLVEKHIIKGSLRNSILPNTIDLVALSPRYIGQWIELDAIQFDSSEKGNSFASEAFDRFDGERRLVDCTHRFSIWLSTSTFAAFQSVILPELSGRVVGILSRDYYDEKYILKLNNPSDIQFQDSRCDPYFQESFEAYPLGRFQASGWENTSVQGSAIWKIFKDEEALGQSISISAYKTDDDTSETWLVSPPIPIPEEGTSFLAFRSSVRRADKSALHSWICEANPSPDARNWLPLDALLATRADDPLYWIESGNISLDAYKGKSIQIGFQYLGSGKTTYDGTYELDDIRIVTE